jgi:hypothetical protein
MGGVLESWRDGAAKQAIVTFVERAVSDVPVQERVAVFDNDGTPWCEKPLPIQADFILRRPSEMARADPELRGRQPWKAAYEHDYGWLGTVMAEHYAGDDTNVRTLLDGVPSSRPRRRRHQWSGQPTDRAAGGEAGPSLRVPVRSGTVGLWAQRS